LRHLQKLILFQYLNSYGWKAHKSLRYQVQASGRYLKEPSYGVKYTGPLSLPEQDGFDPTLGTILRCFARWIALRLEHAGLHRSGRRTGRTTPGEIALMHDASSVFGGRHRRPATADNAD